MSAESPPCLRLLVSPLRDAQTIGRFAVALEHCDGVRTVALDEFAGEAAAFSVLARGVGDLVSGLIQLAGFPLHELKLSAAEITVRLQGQPALRSEPQSNMAAAQPHQAATLADDAVDRLHVIARRLTAQLALLIAEAPAPVALPAFMVEAAYLDRSEQAAAVPVPNAEGTAAVAAGWQLDDEPVWAPNGAASATATQTGATRAPWPLGDAAPRTLQVIAHPFENFTLVNSFINALRRLPGVQHVAPRRFRAGTLQLTVDYAGGEPLVDHLRTLDTFAPRIDADDGETINLAIGGAGR